MARGHQARNSDHDIGAHEDMMTTFLAAAGEPNVKEELLRGKQVGGTKFKVHLDG